MPLVRSIITVLALLFVAAFALLGVFILALALSPRPDPFTLMTAHGRVRWAAAAGAPIPDEFRFLMFPPASGAPLRDSSGFAAINLPPLTRAMINMQAERSLDLIPLAGRHGYFIAAGQLSFWPADARHRDVALAALIADRTSAGPKSALRIEHQRQSGGSELITLRERHEIFLNLYEYQVDPSGQPHPLRWLEDTTRVQDAFSHAFPLFYRLVAGFCLLTLLIIVPLVRRARARRPMPR